MSRFGGQKPQDRGGVPFAPHDSSIWREIKAQERAAYLERKALFNAFEEPTTEENYRGYRLHQPNREHLHWSIETTDGTPLPERLQGVWTHLDRAKAEIDAIMPPKGLGE